MATSNSVNFSLARNELIREAYSLIGIAVDGEPLESDDIDKAARKLNIMLKAWMAYGIKLWKRNSQSLTLVAGQNSYTFGEKAHGTATDISVSSRIVDSNANFLHDNISVGDMAYSFAFGSAIARTATVTAIVSNSRIDLSNNIFELTGQPYIITDADVPMTRPLRILECNRKDSSGNETTINPLTLNEFDNLPNKTSQGTPVNYFYDPTIKNGTFYLWQTPDAATVAEYTIEIVYNAPIEDMDNLDDELDFPQEWYEAVIYGLAYRLAPENGLAQSERLMLKQDAIEALDLARDYDAEDGSLYIQPEVR